MRKEITSYLKTDPDLLQYIREQPYWYRKLCRDPGHLNQCILSSQEYYKKTIPHRVADLSQKLQMASMMINMFQVMREND